MRRAINENPMVQIGLIGVLLAIAALFLLMRGGGAEPAPPPGESAATAAPVTGSTAAATPAGAAAAQPAATATGIGTATADFSAGPGLPRDVLASYRSNDVVVLLVVRRGAIDDELVRGSVEALRRVGGVSVFVTESRHIARYARITQGVAVDRTPALLVIRPQNLTDGVPQASVEYGLRSPRSVVQAVRDAAYDGPERSYDP
jgi:hypothetical protein